MIHITQTQREKNTQRALTSAKADNNPNPM